MYLLEAGPPYNLGDSGAENHRGLLDLVDQLDAVLQSGELLLEHDHLRVRSVQLLVGLEIWFIYV